MPLPKTASTFKEYIHTVSVSYRTYNPSYSPVERIDIVWDVKKPDSLCQHRHKEEESRTLHILGDPGADSGAEDENQNGREKIRRAKVRKKNTSPWGQTLYAPVPNGRTNTRF